MDLRHLRYFVAVAEAGSFLRAAERLHISQPPLSTQIKDLEAELNVRLFERTQKGVELTTAGEVFYVESRAILARVEHARIAAQRADRGEQGSLSVGFVSTADYSILPIALKRFRDQFPAVDVQLQELTTDAQLRELANDQLDVGIALGPINDPSFTFIPVLRERLMLAVPLEYPSSRAKRPISLKYFKDYPFVMVPRHLAPGLHDVTTSLFQAARFSPQISQYAKQMQTVISLVAGNFGVAIVPESLRQMQRTGVQYLSLKDKTPLIETGVLFRANSANPAAIRFKDAVIAAATSFQIVDVQTL